MLKSFLPKEEDFFILFKTIADELVEGSKQFQALLHDLQHSDRYAAIIKQHEEKADTIVDTTLAKLHKTFITPFDRYDIHRFVQNLDDVLDSINRTTKRIVIYKVEKVTEEINAIGLLCVHCSEALREAVGYLSNLKNATKILELCGSIDSLEVKAEQLLLSGVSRLFQEETDFRNLLKIKEIYEYSKGVIKNAQWAAHVIKDVVLEYS